MPLFRRTLRRLLSPLSLAYGIGVRYDRERKLTRRYRSSLPVISIGNISVGGSGKTPLTIYLVDRLQEEQPILLLSRGYGRRGSESVLWNAGEPIPSPELTGDEPALIARSLRQGAIGIASDRGALLETIESQFMGSLVLLDDGFQHHSLARDLDIVIVDDRTAENARLLPTGDLRERPEGLRRAGIVLVTSLGAERFAMEWMSDRSELFRVRFHADTVRKWSDKSPLPKDVVPLLVTGIARPERVVVSLHELGVSPAAHLRFRDHHHYRDADVERIVGTMKRSGATCIVTTAKDAVKLERVAELSDLLYVIDLHVAIADESRFLDHVRSVIINKQH